MTAAPEFSESKLVDASPGNPRRDLAEVAIGYLLILATVWTPSPWQRWLFWITFLWIVVATLLRHPGWKALGLTGAGLPRSLWIVALALALASAAIFAARELHTLHHLHGPTPIFSHVWGYLLWAVLQEFLLQSYFLIRLLRLTRRPIPAVLLAAGLFAVAHLPNLVLAPVTLVWATVACLLFLRYRNIYALGIAHGILGLCVAVTLPNAWHHHMRVGLGYLSYHPHRRHFHPQRSQIDQSVSTEACVTADAPTLRC